MKAVQIVGHRNSGKTTITTQIIRELRRRNLTVGSIKHSAHSHEPDKPGKDSHLHRTAGASPAAMITEGQIAIYLPRNRDRDPAWLMENHYQDVDITVIEGWISGPFKKIEVWRKATGKEPLSRTVGNAIAMVSDDDPSCGLPVFPCNAVEGIVDFILAVRETE